MMTPVLLATRWTVTGSVEGRGGGPAGRAPRSSRAWSQVSGLGRVRSSTRVAGSKNIRVFCSILMRHQHAAEDLRGDVVAAGRG